MPERIFGAPPLCIQGAGALAQLPPLLAGFGRRPFVIADGACAEPQRQEIEQQLKSATDRVILGVAQGYCTEAELERFADTARTLEADVLAALGGGTAMSIAKGLAITTGLPLVTVPTAPCCHLPVSRFLEVEGEDGRFLSLRAVPEPPAALLVDTTAFAASPARVFIAGIGDALARRFEVEQGAAGTTLNLLDGKPTRLAAAAAESAWSAIREHAIPALAQRTRRSGGEALERVVEAMVLLSGIAHESGGPSIAHALARGFAGLPACRTALHGELVAVALLGQLVFEARPAELVMDIVDFHRSLGLPVRLADIGIVADQETVVEAATRRGVPLEAKRLAQAVFEADVLAGG